MRILVVCGAGASSTFVAMRLRKAAQRAGVSIQASAGTHASLPIDLDSADVLLVGPHLEDQLTRIRELAANRGVLVSLLPDDVFADQDGTRTLAHARDVLSTPAPADGSPHPDLTA
ncbi:PTS sugar transporter [Microbacterium sp. LRZ72]|uniref:PTS sugar transporter subunit IIB n=1 Tax=Microbacterium sp. LRZ72 TaxID=2942481 RepID=UPI0029B5FB09|nr:PTS sugar transporter [Microbacterium sp. LRZ72]MDX2376987.1 PTS sugar transporter [Microbacterium sp. LRZ72]